ncbi:MAG TPA: DNA-3-methyladenine glycosylase 2 family protein [Thermodesulfobacteriota bacterium]|nr:DNA-3-methyladenine glycosylase 2 family protein [Thermodesulfobacteriota bacterium]HQO77887.1 DNA-3-methyladenine glycosylase 2 family protein [Thermodesulfobacteriota bacterium]
MQKIVNRVDIKKLIKKDNTFLYIHEKYGDPPNWKRDPGFESLSRIILEQQISLASANAHYNKLKHYLPEFTPDEILKLSDEEMRKCQISRQKAAYLRALATAVKTKSIIFEKLEPQSEQEVRERLTSIKGIGTWTADIYLLFCLQRKDIFPSGDIALINTVKELYRLKTKDDAVTLSENWKPLRSLAAFFFWHYYLRSRNRT